MRAGIKVTGLEEARRNMERLGKSFDAERDRINQAQALETQSVIVRSIEHGPASGRVYGNHQASAPGEPPMTDDSGLINSIGNKAVGDDVYVFSTERYAPMLEFGTRHMRPRPYFTPAVEQSRRRYRERWDNALERAAKGIK